MNAWDTDNPCPECDGAGMHADVNGVGRCEACDGTGETEPPRPLRTGLVAVACIAAAVVGSTIPSGWWLG